MRVAHDELLGISIYPDHMDNQSGEEMEEAQLRWRLEHREYVYPELFKRAAKTTSPLRP